MHIVLPILLTLPGFAAAPGVGADPLLFVARESGRTTRVRVVQARTGPRASVLWRGIEALPEARLDRERVLVSVPHGLAVLDLDSGEVEPVEPEGGSELLSVDRTRGEILFYTHLDSPEHFMELTLEPLGEDYRAVEWVEPVAALQAIPMDLSDPHRPLFDRPVQRVVAASDDVLLVVEARPSTTLWAVPRDGTPPRAIADLDPDWILTLTTSALSPDGGLLAFGAAHRDRYYHARDLLVLDLETGETVLDRREVPASVSPISSFAPRLELAWLDDHTLRHCETAGDVDGDFSNARFQWVDVDVRTGERVAEHPYSKVKLRHAPPPRDTEPAAPVESAPADAGILAVSPDGRWAVTQEPDARVLWLDDRVQGSRVRLARGEPGDYAFHWLPAVE